MSIIGRIFADAVIDDGNTINVDHIEVPSVKIEYKGYTITEESSFGTPWKIVDPQGKVVEHQDEETLEEVKATIDWLASCEPEVTGWEGIDVDMLRRTEPYGSF